MLFAQGGSLSLYVWLSIYMSVFLSIWLSICLSIYLFVCFYLTVPIWLSIYLSVYMLILISLSVCLSDCPSISAYPSSCLSLVYLFICVSVSLFPIYVYLPVPLPTCLAYIHLFIHAFINFYSFIFIHTFIHLFNHSLSFIHSPIHEMIHVWWYIHIHFFSFIEQWVSSKSLSSSDVIVRPTLPYSLIDVLNFLNLALKFFPMRSSVIRSATVLDSLDGPAVPRILPVDHHHTQAGGNFPVVCSPPPFLFPSFKTPWNGSRPDHGRSHK